MSQDQGHKQGHEEVDLIEHDKSDWGEGPWQHEPDRIQWNYAGFACLMVRSEMGHWCGYVGLPEDHPYFGEHYDQAELPGPGVHGGLTYSDFCQGPICHVPEPGFPDRVWWLGFDCAHSGDVSPRSEALLRKHRLPSLTSVLRFPWPNTYKDEAYVRAEVESLAEQLAGVSASNNAGVAPTKGEDQDGRHI